MTLLSACRNVDDSGVSDKHFMNWQDVSILRQVNEKHLNPTLNPTDKDGLIDGASKVVKTAADTGQGALAYAGPNII